MSVSITRLLRRHRAPGSSARVILPVDDTSEGEVELAGVVR